VAQKADSTKSPVHFSGAISVTNNGISLVPTFSLGKPAVLFHLSRGKGRLSFDPDMRFALQGKPWSFLFWWRYQLVKTKKFAMKLGAHPALNFKTQAVTINGVAQNQLIARRYLAGELTPNYFLSKNISIGLYYLYSRGFDEGSPKNTHFLTVNSNFSHIKLPNRFYMKFTPQLYYLKQDKLDGYYATAALALAKQNFPLSLSTIVNKTIHTNIASKNFVWNINLVYSFNKTYARH
jgi:hypothetical protein